jgi:uncharacterized protein YabN with tetrapyrrole methylase and pyrophosphatase domain
MTALKQFIALENDARQFGFDWPNQAAIINQIIDECREIREDIEQNAEANKIQEEIGDLLHAAISLCIFSGFEVEETLTKAKLKFQKRLSSLKKVAKARGFDNLKGQQTSFMLELWKTVKELEKH